jgi:hypothetical protein
MRWFLVLQMVWGPYLPLAAHAQTVIPEKQVLQLFVDKALDDLLPRLQSAKNATDWEELLPPLAKKDREFARAELAKIKKAIKFKRLNRGLSYEYGGRKFTVVMEDLHTRRVRFNNGIEFVYQPNNPLKVQIEVLARALDTEHASVMDWILPKAHALDPFTMAVVMGIIGLLLNNALNQPLNDYFGNVLYEKYREWKCKDKTRETAYTDFTLCQKYFDWKDAVQKEQRMPDKVEGPTIKPNTTTDLKDIKKLCSSATDPDYYNEAVSADNKIRNSIRVKFKGKKVTKILFNSTSKPDWAHSAQETHLIFELDENGGLLKVIDGETNQVLATADKSAIGKMTIAQLQENEDILKKVAALWDTAKSFVKTCNSENSLSVKADLPGNLPLEDVSKTAVIPPSVPTTKQLTSPATTVTK